MNILFVAYHHLDSNSGIHIFNLANDLTRLGAHCTVCVPEQKDAVYKLGQPLFEVIEYKNALQTIKLGKIDLIHAWTPREGVRKITEQLSREYGCPYIVHLEDNEEILLESFTGRSMAHLCKLSPERLDKIIPLNLSHPFHYKEFINKAQGVTVLMDTLLKFCPGNIPAEVIWAGYEEEIHWYVPPDVECRRRLKIDDQENVIVYTGNVHQANRREVFSLYLAVGLLNRRGIRTKLVRTGTNFVPLLNAELEEILKKYYVELGHISRKQLPALLSIANILVQPGSSNEFNDYRFPSKIPEYLASGKPVLLPATNIGRFLKDGEECILLHKGGALEISQKLESLFPNKALCEKVGNGGRHFAEKNLKWSVSAKKLRDFYVQLLNRGKRIRNDIPLSTVENSRINRDPIIIYQMGKVGSKTVENTLIQAYSQLSIKVPIYHRHILNPRVGSEEILRRERVNPEGSLEELTAGRALRKKIEENITQKWKLISLVRDPIARNVATFFQNLQEFIPDWRNRFREGMLDVDELQDKFLSIETIHDEPNFWFDGQLKAVFGIDVFASTFPQSIGYKIYDDEPRFLLLVIRLEDLNRSGLEAIERFLGLGCSQLANTNIGSEKEYVNLYNAFKKKALPLGYIQRIYDTKFAQHFYSQEEREKFSAQWTHKL
ncbi:MAG: putative capsular polysaccharide synthesis family protein [Moraxellaceae bacterium]|nr:putative capsular polysaccharide synthesis family protein [Moraxellaceae bacterium]